MWGRLPNSRIAILKKGFLHGFVTLFTWLIKKCCEALQQEMQRHGKNVALRLFERHLQGESDSLTGCKWRWDREKNGQLWESSGRVFYQRRPLLISAAAVSEVGSVRCVPVFIRKKCIGRCYFWKKCVPLQEIWRITIIAWTGGASISNMACQELIMSLSRWIWSIDRHWVEW